MPSSQKEGQHMNMIMDNGLLIEVIYKKKLYQYLEFIRLDNICQKTYVTCKNIVTGEMYTFDEEYIDNIITNIQSKPDEEENPVAI
ncbi:hypothetical protein V4V35_20510 [Bacillus infantis]|uniref:hypothetical protein n=1 Tax=Bacillus infantis TaxID=324767 RepID=UPI002FBD8F7E